MQSDRARQRDGEEGEERKRVKQRKRIKESANSKKKKVIGRDK